MDNTNPLSGFYLTKCIGKTLNRIVLLLSHNSDNLVILAGVQVKNIIKVTGNIFLPYVVGEYGNWTKVKICIYMLTGKPGTWTRAD